MGAGGSEENLCLNEAGALTSNFFLHLQSLIQPLLTEPGFEGGLFFWPASRWKDPFLGFQFACFFQKTFCSWAHAHCHTHMCTGSFCLFSMYICICIGYTKQPQGVVQSQASYPLVVGEASLHFILLEREKKWKRKRRGWQSPPKTLPRAK